MRIKLDETYLNSIKQQLIKKLNLPPIIVDGMNKGSGALYVENLKETINALMVSRPNEIALDKQFMSFDTKGNVTGYNPNLYKLITSQLGHELLHAASRDNNNCGIMKYSSPNSNNYRGLNEGITQMYTEDAFGYVVSKFTDGYKNFKKIAKIMRMCVGDEPFRNSFFFHKNDLEKVCNNMAGNNNFYADLNKALTDLYYLPKINIISPALKNIYDSRIKACFSNIIIYMVIPKLKSLKSEDEKKQFINNILKIAGDDKEIEYMLADLLKNQIHMTPTQLEEEKRKIKLFDKQQTEKYKLINLMNSKQSQKFTFMLDEKGNITYKKDNGETFKISKDEELCEYIYDYLYESYFKGQNFDIDKFIEENIIKANKNINFPQNWNNKLKRIFFSHLKTVAKQKGIIILNSYTECDNITELKVDYINKDIQFNDLKTLLSRYDLRPQNENDLSSPLIVVDKKTNKKINDNSITSGTKFAYLWLSTSKRQYVNEPIPGYTDAFCETNKDVYNELMKIASKNIKDTGNLDLNQLLNLAENNKNTRFLKVLRGILNNSRAYELVYRFIKLKNPNAMLQTEREKSYSEQDNYKYEASMRGVLVEQIMNPRKR